LQSALSADIRYPIIREINRPTLQRLLGRELLSTT
jgi:hypothetical protein